VAADAAPARPSPSGRILLIINPISGTGGRPAVARRRKALAERLVQRHRLDATIVLTECGGHARALAGEAVNRGAAAVVAWGGDGTVNEVASALAYTKVPLGVIPSGSGNGLARDLGIPLEPSAAFAVAVFGRDRLIDCGDVDGHLFFNIAGIGIDARIAEAFSAGGLGRRGLRRYLELTVRELFRFVPEEHAVVADELTLRVTPLLIAIANSRQYGHGALIAPGARVDDGKLDVVVVAHRSPWRALRDAPMLFAGKVTRVAGVRTLPASAVEVTSPARILYHVDGETRLGGTTVTARVHPRALRVRVGRLAMGEG
jgi:YegS/Rv2252/BmrU family lipid kinase